MDRSVARLRVLVLVVAVVVVFLAISAPLMVAFYVSKENAETQLFLGCQNARANIQSLQAIKRNGVVLDDIAHYLGLPVPSRPFIPVPEVPPECIEP